jgi:hypothetical protein
MFCCTLLAACAGVRAETTTADGLSYALPTLADAAIAMHGLHNLHESQCNSNSSQLLSQQQPCITPYTIMRP